MRIGICHYRVGRTDGVSLEIEKRKQILEKMGHQVKLVAGPQSVGCDCVIPELEFDLPDIKELKENLFNFFHNQSLSRSELEQAINCYAEIIEQKLCKIQQREQFDALLVHNIFSHGRHVSAAKAFYNVIKEYHLPTISTNHDYYWERPEYADLRFQEIEGFLDCYLPPSDPLIKHVSINSIASEKLKEKCGIVSTVMPDVFDFSQSQWTLDDFNLELPETIRVKPDDLIVLQATRISPRKGIELAVQVVKELMKIKTQLIGKPLYNGKVLNNDSDIVFVLAGYAEDECKPYEQLLKELIVESGINARFINPLIAVERLDMPQKKYSLWDAYVFADLVTYPSLLEGWGNQFIEAVFAKKPTLLFEYPVFKKDIKPEGYSYLSLGDQIARTSANGLVEIEPSQIQAVVQNVVETFLDSNTHNLLQQNFLIGKKFHDYRIVRSFLEQQFNSC